MDRKSRLRRKVGAFAMMTVMAVVATWVLVSGMSNHAEIAAATRSQLLKPTGSAQLVSVEPLPEMNGQMCELTPASASSTLAAALSQEQMATARSAPSADARAASDIDRAPLRVIRDPYPSFSAIAVEPKSNMLVVTDENLFRVLEYNREDNTPPGARLTEPKRVVGGDLTKAEMVCGVYIDPVTQETYVVNNDTQDWLAVFSKNARGNVAPDRWLEVPHQTFGIAVDEGRQELYLTVQGAGEVVVYRKTASGHDAALRKLQGDATHLEDPHGIAVDTKADLLFVSNHGSVSYRDREAGDGKESRSTGKFDPPSITIYARDAKGNTAPLRVISGPKTELDWPMQIAVDEERGELYVANDTGQSLLVFKTSDSGNVAPTRIIKGPKTGVKNPTGVALDLKNKEVWLSNMGNHSATAFSFTADGNVPPLRTVRGGPGDELSLMIGNPGAVAYDTKREEILVPN